MKRPQSHDKAELLRDPLGAMENGKACLLFERKHSHESFMMTAPGDMPVLKGPYLVEDEKMEQRCNIMKEMGVKHIELERKVTDARKRIWYAYDFVALPVFDVKTASTEIEEPFHNGRKVRVAEKQKIGLTDGFRAWKQNLEAFSIWMLNVGIKGLVCMYMMRVADVTVEDSIICRLWTQGMEGWFFNYERENKALDEGSFDVVHTLFHHEDKKFSEFNAWFKDWIQCYIKEVNEAVLVVIEKYVSRVPKMMKNTSIRRGHYLVEKLEREFLF